MVLAIVNTRERVDRMHQCAVFGIGSGHAKMCLLNTLLSVSEPCVVRKVTGHSMTTERVLIP